MRIWLVGLIYTLAFIAGLATLWAFTALGVMDMFEGRTDSLFVLLMVPFLAALCVFSVVYGLASGRALKWRYWLFGTGALAMVSLIAPRIVMAGYIDVFGAFVVIVLLVFTIGFLFALQRDAVTGGQS